MADGSTTDLVASVCSSLSFFLASSSFCCAGVSSSCCTGCDEASARPNSSARFILDVIGVL